MSLIIELCNTLQHAATRCNTLQLCIWFETCFVNHDVIDNRALQHTATHCNSLQHTATHCNTLQHTATHCNTLQHTATHCNTLQHTATEHILSITMSLIIKRSINDSLVQKRAPLFYQKYYQNSWHIKGIFWQMKGPFWQMLSIWLLWFKIGLFSLNTGQTWCLCVACVAACCSVLQCVAVRCSVLQCVAACCSVLQCVAVCCSVLQCVAVCYSML